MKIAKIAGWVVALIAVLAATVAAQSGDVESFAKSALPLTGETMARVAIALFLATVAEFLVDGLVAPVFEKFNLDRFWLRYIAWGVASGIVALSAINLFDSYVPVKWMGQILTAVFCGGGSNKVHDFFDKYVSKKAKSKKPVLPRYV